MRGAWWCWPRKRPGCSATITSAASTCCSGCCTSRAARPADVLAAAGITLEAARAQVEELAGPGGKSPAGHIPFTQRAKKILELSLREALEQRKSYIGTEHILLALMRDADGMGARVLERLGGSLPALRQRVLEAAKAAAARPRRRGRGAEHGDVAAWDWRPAQDFAREARVPAADGHGVPSRCSRPIDQRLAGIERRLGITADEEAAAGFRGLLASVNRHLANIERHLGIAARAAEPEADGRSRRGDQQAE